MPTLNGQRNLPASIGNQARIARPFALRKPQVSTRLLRSSKPALDTNGHAPILSIGNCCNQQLFMDNTARQCAREILETVPLVMRFIRDQVRRRRTAGLSLPQFRALIFLSRTKNSSLSAVAEHLGLSLPAMSRLINGLVGNQLVARQTVSSNRRQIALTLTTRGQTMLEKVRDEIRLRLADSLKNLPVAEQNTVQRAMRALQKTFDHQMADGNRSSQVNP
jgi:DNA-binding MarR family transcriptional regulator